MTTGEKRILQNQFEILWTLHWLVGKTRPDLVGRDGEVDRMRDDLRAAAKDTQAILDNRSEAA